MKAGTGWKRTTETCGEGGPRGANEIRDWVGKDPIARGLAAQLPHWHQSIRSSICGREESIFSIFFGDLMFFLWVGVQENRLVRWQPDLPEDTCCGIQLISKEVTSSQRSWAELLMESHVRTGKWMRQYYWWTTKPSGLCRVANLFLYTHFKAILCTTGLGEELGAGIGSRAVINILCLQYVFP